MVQIVNLCFLNGSKFSDMVQYGLKWSLVEVHIAQMFQLSKKNQNGLLWSDIVKNILK